MDGITSAQLAKKRLLASGWFRFEPIEVSWHEGFTLYYRTPGSYAIVPYPDSWIIELMEALTEMNVVTEMKDNMYKLRDLDEFMRLAYITYNLWLPTTE